MEKANVKGNNVKILNNYPADINIIHIFVKNSQNKVLLPSLGFKLVADMEKLAFKTSDYSFDRNQIVS